MEPLQVFENFLALSARGPLSAASRDEFLEDELAQDYSGAPRATPLVCNAMLRIDATHAVARVTIEQPARKVPFGREGGPEIEAELPAREVDTYWFLSKTNRWHVGAQRALAQTGLYELILAFSPSHDSIETESRANARLTLSSDRELARWYREHQGEIEALAEAARGLAARGEEKSFTDTSVLADRLHALHVTAAEVLADDGVDIVVGGMADNSVLFRNVPTGERPPITPNHVIWAEALGGGWFLVRTT